jgi:uncharacterized protein YndB with AHSA1/START domain
MSQSDQPQRTAAAAQNPTTVARTSERELTVTRTFEAPAPAVFDAWTRPELFRQWWAPRSMGATLSACEIDARAGGGYRITFGEGADAATFFGRYLEVTTPSRLVWTNEESGEAPVTTVTFEDQGPRTRLALRELYPSADPLPDALAGMEAMMAEQFAQLDELLAVLQRPAKGGPSAT